MGAANRAMCAPWRDRALLGAPCSAHPSTPEFKLGAVVATTTWKGECVGLKEQGRAWSQGSLSARVEQK